VRLGFSTRALKAPTEEKPMNTMNERRVLVVAGSRGLGLGVVQALVAEGAQVTVLARDGGRLAEAAAALPVATIQGDMVDAQVIDQALASVQPEVLILNGGTTPHMAPRRPSRCNGLSAPTTCASRSVS
jgi:NAD(P)-dependent dehydrogenase (short-subunit alcohol dehydrogenase family)